MMCESSSRISDIILRFMQTCINTLNLHMIPVTVLRRARDMVKSSRMR